MVTLEAASEPGDKPLAGNGATPIEFGGIPGHQAGVVMCAVEYGLRVILALRGASVGFGSVVRRRQTRRS